MDERTNGPRRRPANGVQRLLLVLALLAAGLLLVLPLTMIFAQVADSRVGGQHGRLRLQWCRPCQ